MNARTLLLLLVSAVGCDDDPRPPPPPLGPSTFSPGGAVAPAGGVVPPTTASGTTFGTDGAGTVGGDATATDPQTPGPATDSSDDVDTIASIECMSTCDCPPLTRCTADGCMPTSQLIWCCSEPTCPSGADCQDERGDPGTCP